MPKIAVSIVDGLVETSPDDVGRTARKDDHQWEGSICNERCRRGQAFPVPERRAEVIAAVEAAIARVHDESGVELYALHERRDRLVMIEKYESRRRRPNTPRARRSPTCCPLWRASSAATSTSRCWYLTRPETRRRARSDRSPDGTHVCGRRGGIEPGLSDRGSRHLLKLRHQRPVRVGPVADSCDAGIRPIGFWRRAGEGDQVQR
jgi:hypothetical protein